MPHNLLSPRSSPRRVASPKAKNVVDIAVENPNFSTLVSLLKKAKLVGALKKGKNLTVFAPTNDAFAKLDKDLVKHLTSPQGAKELKEILLYHVLGNQVKSDMIKGSATPVTLQGKNLCVYLKGGKVKVNDGQVVKADILGSNGVIHVVDTVLTPLNNCSGYGF